MQKYSKYKCLQNFVIKKRYISTTITKFASIITNSLTI